MTGLVLLSAHSERAATGLYTSVDASPALSSMDTVVRRSVSLRQSLVEVLASRRRNATTFGWSDESTSSFARNRRKLPRKLMPCFEKCAEADVSEWSERFKERRDETTGDDPRPGRHTRHEIRTATTRKSVPEGQTVNRHSDLRESKSWMRFTKTMAALSVEASFAKYDITVSDYPP